jgi:hypothetical protein
MSEILTFREKCDVPAFIVDPIVTRVAAVQVFHLRGRICVLCHVIEDSHEQISAAKAAIWKQAGAGKWTGFKISTIVALTAVDDGIIVDGTYTAIPAARRASLVRKLSTTVLGVPVHLAPGHTFSLSDGRDADTAPFNAGGLMETFNFHNGSQWFCSSGFAIAVNGTPHTTTAAHCDYSDFVDANDGNAPTAPPTTQWYGNAGQTLADGGALVLGNTGFTGCSTTDTTRGQR